MTNQKIIICISIIVILIGVLTACNQHKELPSVVTEQLTEQSAENRSASNTETETTKTSSLSDNTTESTSTQVASASSIKDSSTTQTPSTTNPTSAPKQTTTTTTVITMSSTKTTTTTKPTTKRQTTTKKETTTVKSIDIDSYVNYAISYGKSIGLNYDSSVTECWDNPIIVSTDGSYAKRDIKSRLNRYKNVEGFTDFGVWAEKRSDGDYDLYIAYA